MLWIPKTDGNMPITCSNRDLPYGLPPHFQTKPYPPCRTTTLTLSRWYREMSRQARNRGRIPQRESRRFTKLAMRYDMIWYSNMCLPHTSDTLVGDPLVDFRGKSGEDRPQALWLWFQQFASRTSASNGYEESMLVAESSLIQGPTSKTWISNFVPLAFYEGWRQIDHTAVVGHCCEKCVCSYKML